MNSVSIIADRPDLSPPSAAGTDDPPIHAAAARRLGAAGLRYTSGRRRLVEILGRSGIPLTVDDFLATDRRLAMSSVYRDLHHLCDVDVLARLSLVHDRHHFQFTADIIGRRELHFVCAGCATVTAVTSPRAVDDLVARAARRASTSAFRTDRGRLVLSGRCSACRV